MNETKYYQLINTISDIEIYVKVDFWNGGNIERYNECTVYNGLTLIQFKNDDKIKRIYVNRYISFNHITIENEIDEEEYEKITEV